MTQSNTFHTYLTWIFHGSANLGFTSWETTQPDGLWKVRPVGWCRCWNDTTAACWMALLRKTGGTVETVKQILYLHLYPFVRRQEIKRDQSVKTIWTVLVRPHAWLVFFHYKNTTQVHWPPVVFQHESFNSAARHFVCYNIHSWWVWLANIYNGQQKPRAWLCYWKFSGKI